MKRYIGGFILISTLILLCVSSGCSGKGSDKKFNPEQKESTMTESERKAAIDSMRIAMNQVDTALIFGNGIKLTVLKPKPSGNLTEDVANLIGQRMLDMASANGISGVGGDPAMVFACGITNIGKKLTGTTPQKTEVTLDIQYYVADVASGTVFGSLSDQVIGVGNDEDAAYLNAARELENSAGIQKMLKSAKKEIVGYYTQNSASLRSQIEGLIAKGDYERAYSMLRGVPEQCSSLFEYSRAQLPVVSRKILEKDAAVNLAHFKSAMAANNEEYADVVGDIMALIPAGTPEYKEAQSDFTVYLQNLDIKADKRAKIEAEKADAEHRRKMETLVIDAQIAHDQAVEGRWDKGFELVGHGIECAREVGVTYGRNSSWTSFLNPSNLVSSLKDAFKK